MALAVLLLAGREGYSPECVTGTGTKDCATGGTLGHHQMTQEREREETLTSIDDARYRAIATPGSTDYLACRQRAAKWRSAGRESILYRLPTLSKSPLVRRSLLRHNAVRRIRRKEKTMDASIFRAAQEPLKERYRADAKAALLTLKAKGRADDSTVTCKVETGRGLAVAGIHPKCGGSGLELCSGDLLLEALIACAGVSLKAAASVLDIPIKSATISAEGDVDLRGTLGITDGVPVGFKEIRLHFDVETDAPQSDLAQLLGMTERYCVIFQTIQGSPNTKARMSVVRN